MTLYLGKYAVAFTFLVPITKVAVQDFAVGADWTPAAGDVKVSKDDAAFVNIATLPTVVGNHWLFSLSTDEMTAARTVVQVVDSASKAVEDASFTVHTVGNVNAMLAFDLDSANVVVGSLVADAINAAAIATDAIGADEFAQGAADKVFGASGLAIPELAQAAPADTPTPAEAIMFLYMAAINQLTTAGGFKNIANAAGVIIAKKAVSDSGSAYTETKAESGP